MDNLAFAPQHNMVAYLEKTESNAEFHQIVDFLTLSFIHHALTIHATVDGKTVVITESLVRRDLFFTDDNGSTCLTNAQIFENLFLMEGTGFPHTRRPNFHDPSVDVEAVHKEVGDSLVRAATTASLDAQQDNSNIAKTHSKATLNEPNLQEEGSSSGPRCQETIGSAMAQIRSEGAPIQSSDPPLSTGNTVRSEENMMEHAIDLRDPVLDLEKVKTAHAKKISSLKKRVTKLEQRQSSRISDKGSGEKGGSTAETVSTARPDITAKVKISLGYNSQFNKKEVLDVKDEEVTEIVFDNRLSNEKNGLANDRFKKGEGFQTVPPPLNGNYMPPKPDLSFAGLDDSIYKFKIRKTVTDKMAKKSVLPNNVGKGTGHRESRTVCNNVQRINHLNKFAPTAVFTRSLYNPTAHSRSNLNERVNTAGSKAVSVVKGYGVTDVKASAGCIWRQRVNEIDHISKYNRWIYTSLDYGHPQQSLKNKGIVDSRFSRHMTRNKAYLADYQEINDGGYAAFGSSRGKITGKGLLPLSLSLYPGFLASILLFPRFLAVLQSLAKCLLL
nr:hypothetical protein [Tanacetum cinerariifolium]